MGLKELGNNPLKGHVLHRTAKGRYTLGQKRIMMKLTGNEVTVRDGSKFVSLGDWARCLEPAGGMASSVADSEHESVAARLVQKEACLESLERDTAEERQRLQLMSREGERLSAQGKACAGELTAALWGGEQSLDLSADEQQRGCDAARSPRATVARLRRELLDLQQACSTEISRLSCGHGENEAADVSALQELRDLQLRLESLHSSSGGSSSSKSAVEQGRGGWRSLEMLAEVVVGPEVGKIGIAFEALPPSPMLVRQVAAGTWAADAAAIAEGDELLEVNGRCVRDLGAPEFMALMTARPLSMRLWRFKCVPGVAPANVVVSPTPAPDGGKAVLGSCASAQVQEVPPSAIEEEEEDHFW